MYIEKRRRRWYAIHEIPADVRDTLKRGRRYCQSLETEDEREAKRRAVVLEQRWLLEIEQARSQSPDALERDAAFWKKNLKTATEKDRDIILSFIADKAEDIIQRAAARAGITNDQDPRIEELPEADKARRYFALATGQLVRTDEHIEEWLATKADMQAKQKDMYRSDLKRLATRFPYAQDVTRKDALGWVNDLMGAGGLKKKTVQRILSACRGYWGYLRDIEVVAEDAAPFRELVRDAKGSYTKASAQDARQPFTPEQVMALLRGAEAREDHQMADLIRLGMWTGCRIESLCALRVEDVHDDFFRVLDDKTPAGTRDVPIHSKLRPVLRRLIEESKEGFVLSGLTENKYGDRSNAIGKRFGRLKAAMGFGPQHVFHSIRKTVITQLERRGVPENVTADIVGHDKPTITYGLYSGGNSLETMQEAVERLDYPGWSG